MPEHLADLWNDTVARSPSALAVIDAATGRRWTRAELAELAATIRAELSRHALARRPVIMADRNSATWLAAFLALIELRALPVPLDPGEPPAAQLTLARRLGAAGIWRAAGFERLTPSRPRRAELCLFKLTSGTTGGAKALPFTHDQMIADGRQVCATMGIRPDDVNFAIIPLGHSYGLGNLVLPLIAQGTAIVIGSGALPQIMADEMQRSRPTVFPAVPALLRLLTQAELEPQTFASVRLFISAGAALAPEIAAAFARKFDRRVHGFYGSSETGGICYDRAGEATLEGRSVGPPLEGVRLTFRRGGRFVVTSAAVTGRGSHAPADRGKLNAHGELVLLGRAGRMMKIAGRRLDLAEIENELRRVPGVRDAWAAADPRHGEGVAAVVAVTAGGITPAELRAALSTRIAAWKIPDRMLIVPEFPVTPRGKVDTRALQQMLV